jgi:hypothetical protein
VVLYDVEDSQVSRAIHNITQEVLEFEKEGILRGTLSAADQGRFFYIFKFSSITEYIKMNF